MLEAKGIKTFHLLCAILLGVMVLVSTASAATQADKEALGKLIFSDTRLSSPDGMSCATCHVKNVGFTDPDKEFGTSAGVMPGRFGSRNAPSNRYRAVDMPFQSDPLIPGGFIGGEFWDGRADNLFRQALAPFVNPLEMHNPSRALVVQNLSKTELAPLFKALYGNNAFKDVDVAYENIADAIAAFEKSKEMNPFNSKFDDFIANCLKDNLTLLQILTLPNPQDFGLSTQEYQGFQIFNSKGACFICHQFPRVDPLGNLISIDKATFTDERYFNVGVPRNDNNPFYFLNPGINPDGDSFTDFGLGGRLGDDSQIGAFKVPTLRNIAETSPYFHNGTFQTLKEVVHFYNTRDVTGVVPESKAVNTDNVVKFFNLGNLGLSGEEEDAIVAFVHTLTDKDLR